MTASYSIATVVLSSRANSRLAQPGGCSGGGSAITSIRELCDAVSTDGKGGEGGGGEVGGGEGGGEGDGASGGGQMAQRLHVRRQ